MTAIKDRARDLKRKRRAGGVSENWYLDFKRRRQEQQAAAQQQQTKTKVE